jgi:hypothetical protein
MESVTDAMHIVGDTGDVGAERFELGVDAGVSSDAALHFLDSNIQERQALAQVVMELPRNATALLFLGGEQSRRETAKLSVSELSAIDGAKIDPRIRRTNHWHIFPLRFPNANAMVGAGARRSPEPGAENRRVQARGTRKRPTQDSI